MKTSRLILIAIAITFLTSAFAQNKYAVLITGDPKPTSRDDVPEGGLWPGGDSECNEFWNDTFIFHEMLVNKFHFSEENVYVFYAGYTQYHPENYPYRYTDNQEPYFVDGSSTSAHVIEAFNTLKNTMNQNDFLFVWVFSHGWKDQSGAYFYLNDINMTQTSFAALINPIPAAKKVIWMQSCSGGSFAESFVGQDNVIFTSAASANDIAHRADDLDKNGIPLLAGYEENDLWPSYLYSCNHGEFDYHMYSSTVGESPSYKTEYGNAGLTPFSNADTDGDNVVSVYEAYSWEASYQSRGNINNNLNPETPLWQEFIEGFGAKTSLNYPNLVSSRNDLVINSTNTGTLLNTGIYGITSNIEINNNESLIFGENSKIYLLNNAKIYVLGDATLKIQNGVEIYGNGQNSIRIENGTLNLGQYVLFSSNDEDNVFGGVYLSALASPTQISNATFHRARLWNESLNLSLNITSFDHVATSEEDIYGVYSTAGDVSIIQSTFTGTSVFLKDSKPLHYPNLALIQHCVFHGGGINIEGYHNFKIENNAIEFSNGPAIILHYAGNGSSGNQSIYQNNLYNSLTGVFLNNSHANLICNNIHENQRGVYVGNFSNISLVGGNSLAQKIKNCFYEEIYIENDCFPYSLFQNEIVHESNALGNLHPLLRYNNYPPNSETKDVKYNCWGPDFNHLIDLVGDSVTFEYLPKRCPGDPIPWEPPVDLFASAINQYDSGNYTEAKSLFKTTSVLLN